MLKKFLLAAALSVASIFAFAQPYYPLTGLGIAGSATSACSTANAVLYNASTPCSANLTYAGNATLAIGGTAGDGLTLNAGVATTNARRAVSITAGWTDGTSSNIGIVGNFDMGATGTATGKLLSLQAGAAGTTEVFSVSQSGVLTASSDITSSSGTFSGNNFTASAAGWLAWSARAIMYSPVNGTVSVRNAAETKQFLIAAALPVIGSCGTNPAVAGVDSAMTVTVGTATPASCAVTFSAAKTTAPACSVVSTTDDNLLLTTSTTAVTVTRSGAANFTDSSTLRILCFEYL